MITYLKRKKEQYQQIVYFYKNNTYKEASHNTYMALATTEHLKEFRISFPSHSGKRERCERVFLLQILFEIKLHFQLCSERMCAM